MDESEAGREEMTAGSKVPASTTVPPKSTLKTVVFGRNPLGNDDGDTEMDEAVGIPRSIASEPTAQHHLKSRKKRAGIPNLSEDDGEHENGNNHGKVAPSKRRRKAKPAKPATSIDTDVEEQQHPQALEVPPAFEISRTALAGNEQKNPKRPDKTIIIARRKRWEKGNLEVLIWNDGELE